MDRTYKDDVPWLNKNKLITRTTIAERKKIMAHIHGKRATKNFLKKCGITDSAECHQCNIPTHKQIRRLETDRHVMCYCTNQRAQKGRILTSTLISQELTKHIDPYSCKLMEWIYGNNTNTGRTNDFKINKAPAMWRNSHNKESKRTLQEIQQGLVIEIILNMDNPMPIWSGIITKAHIRLLQNAKMPQAHMIKTIKFIRETLKEHSRTLWKHRCITLEEEHKPNTRITLEEAKKIAKN